MQMVSTRLVILVQANEKDKMTAMTVHSCILPASHTHAIAEEGYSMFCALQVLTVLLVAIALVPSLAHALEFPGKLRLDKEAYYAMQPVYYPGFTIAGISEPLGIVAMILLLVMTLWGSAGFWLMLMALLGLIGMQAIYWLVTHPVNQFWVEGAPLNRVSSGFFSFGIQRSQPGNTTPPPEWTVLRDQWEYSHVARAACALVSFLALVIAIACSP